jgi:hypothetical protein
MHHSTTYDRERAEFLIQVTGEMSLDGGKKLLTAGWGEHDYVADSIIIYDVGALDVLPDINGMPALSYFAVSNRESRGPNKIAFVSPEFKLDVVKRSLSGSTPIIRFDISYFNDISAAREWASI